MIESKLTSGEQVIMRGRISQRAICGLFWMFLVLGILFGLFPLPVFLIYWLYLKSIAWYVTNKRIILKSGLLSTSTSEIGCDRIGEIQSRQGAFLDKLFGTASLTVNDTGMNNIKLQFVGNPEDVKKVISEQVYASRSVK